MHIYLDLLRSVLQRGTQKTDRTGVGTISLAGQTMRFDLTQGFPLVTTKKLHLKSVVHELLWFLAGDTNIAYLRRHGVSIWNEWAREDGDLGPIYGAQWRRWQGADGSTVDQISNALELMRNNPDSRRIIVSAWNVSALPEMQLAPCHLLFQFYVADNKLSCILFQRSADLFLGVPFNIASYALLTHIMAQQADLQVGELVWLGGDCHIYLNHLQAVNTQLQRHPRPLPELLIKRRPPSPFDYCFEDFEFVGYHPEAAIKAAVAV